MSLTYQTQTRLQTLEWTLELTLTVRDFGSVHDSRVVTSGFGDNDSNFCVYVTPSSSLAVKFTTDSSGGSTETLALGNLSSGSPHRITVTATDSSVKLYVDGVAVTSYSGPREVSQWSDLVIGDTEAAEYEISDLRFWDSEMTESDVLASHASGKSPSMRGLLLDFSMNGDTDNAGILGGSLTGTPSYNVSSEPSRVGIVYGPRTLNSPGSWAVLSTRSSVTLVVNDRSELEEFLPGTSVIDKSDNTVRVWDGSSWSPPALVRAGDLYREESTGEVWSYSGSSWSKTYDSFDSEDPGNIGSGFELSSSSQYVSSHSGSLESYQTATWASKGKVIGDVVHWFSAMSGREEGLRGSDPVALVLRSQVGPAFNQADSSKAPAVVGHGTDWSSGGFLFDDTSRRFESDGVDDFWSGGGRLSVVVTPTDYSPVFFKKVSSLSPTNESSGWGLSVIDDGGDTELVFHCDFSGTYGQWVTSGSGVFIGKMCVIEVFFDSSEVSPGPEIFVNGASVSVTELSSPTGSPVSDTAQPLSVGGQDAAFSGILHEALFVTNPSESESTFNYWSLVNRWVTGLYSPAVTSEAHISDLTPLLTGAGWPGTKVSVYDGDELVAGPLSVGADGSWSTTLALSEGLHSLSLVGFDSLVTSTVSFDLTVDVTLPDAPVILTPFPLFTTDTTPTLTGTTEPMCSVVVYVDGVAPGSPSVADGSGNWSFTFPAMSVGTYSVTARVTDLADNTGPASSAVSLTVVQPVEISGTPVDIAMETRAYEGFTVSATGGYQDLSFSVQSGSLPDGITLNSVTGEVSGTPTETGLFESIVIRAADGYGTFDDLDPFDLEVAADLSISGTPIVTAFQNREYTGFFVSSTGGFGSNAFSVQSGSLPDGITLNSVTGEVSGTPTVYGDFDGVVIRVTDAEGFFTDLAPFDLTVIEELQISGSPVEVATQGVAYTFTVTATGGIPPYTFSVQSGSLPDGITLDSVTGEVSGTPTEIGTFEDIVIQVEDSE